MSGTTPGERPDPLLERLRESATGDAAMRQLRRRYDILRNDYEALVDRLMDLEERIAADEARREDEQLELPVPAAPGQEPQTVAESVLAPVLRLRDEYLQAATGIQGIIAGLDNLAAAAFQASSLAQAAPPAPASPAATPAPPAASHSSPVPPQPFGVVSRGAPITIDVNGDGFGELLDFQERLANLPGVAHVSISAIDNERATLVVELEPGS